jgi:hypothetical protein
MHAGVADGLIRTEVYDEAEQHRRPANAETRGLEDFDPDDLERVACPARVPGPIDGWPWRRC